MALGAPGLPAIAGPVGLVSGGTDIVSVAGPSMRGDETTPMSPMESVIEIFTEIRDGINSLVQLATDEASGKELAKLLLVINLSHQISEYSDEFFDILVLSFD